MRIKNIILGLVILALCIALPAFAQEDIEGSKDHPLANRMPGYYISEYVDRDFDSVPFKNEKGQEVDAEGAYAYIDYLIKEGAKAPSPVEIMRNYINAFQKIGGKVVNQGTEEVTLRIEKAGAVTWIRVTPYNAGDGYVLEFLQQKAMTQNVIADAASMIADIAATGHVAVYGITFDADSAVIRPEADAVIAEIAKLLKQNASLKLFVVGHTANVGSVEAGLKLSQARAEAVVKTLTGKHGIAASRLFPYGVGPYCPVSTNQTEEGRAKNRRVELVQQ